MARLFFKRNAVRDSNRSSNVNLQKAVQVGRRISARGWAPLLRGLARRWRHLQNYPARLASGDTFIVDLRETMCYGLFFDGDMPSERGVQTLMQLVLKPGSIFADVGANVGFHARAGAHLVGPSGAVHAFEPMPSALRLLRLNTREFPTLMVHSVAVGNAAGEADFFVRHFGDRSSLKEVPQSYWRDRIRVPVVTLDDVLGDAPVALLKIDVEGFEIDVLRGASKLLRNSRPLVCFEIWDDVTEPELDAYRQFLEEHGYTLHWLQNIAHARTLADLITQERTADAIAVPRENRR